VLFDIDGVGGLDVLALGTGVQVSRTLRLGFTLNGWFNEDWLNGYRLKRVRAVFNPSSQRVRFDMAGWNVNLGAIWTPVENLNLAVVAKTPFTADVTLARERHDRLPEQGEFENAFESDDVRLRLPAAFGFGSSWRPRSQWTISADYTRTLWSDARIFNYFTLPVTGEPQAPGSVFPSLSYPSLTQEPQVDTEQLRAGTEYVFIGRRLKYPVRVGVFSDRQYFRAGDGSIPRFSGFTVGAGIIVGPVMIDGAFVREMGDYGDGDGGHTEVDQRRLVFSLIYRPQPRP
jgi:long-subunit fatty acid transport protein